MVTQIPSSIDEALPTRAPKPAHPLPSLLGMLALWGLCAWALHAVVMPSKPATNQMASAAGQGLTASEALELTDEVVTALAADQLGSVMLKLRLAQKIAARLSSSPASPATEK